MRGQAWEISVTPLKHSAGALGAGALGRRPGAIAFLKHYGAYHRA